MGNKAWLWACLGCGCLAFLVAGAAAGLVVLKAVKAADPPSAMVSGDAMTDELGTEVGEGEDMEVGAETILTDDFLLVVPPDWQRTDDGSESGTLRVLGPQVDGGMLELGLYAEELDAPDITVEEWSEEALTEFADLTWTEDAWGATVGERPARRVSFTAEGSDVVMYLCVSGGKGFVIVMKAPEGTMAQQHDTFAAVLETLEFHGQTDRPEP